MMMIQFFTLLSSLLAAQAFTLHSPIHQYSRLVNKATSTSLHDIANNARRRELLGRNGPYFKLDRFRGAVEFGSSAKLVTKLDANPNPDGIKEWLSDGRGLALSIWDEDLMEDLGDSIYRLQVMKLQFVTIQLAPRVDVKMSTQPDAKGDPVFSLQSVSFDPNIQLFPGVGVSASALGVQIEVSGELRPSKDGTGVSGAISFATKGTLPPPMRLIPEPVFKAASDAINESIVKLAVQSFEKGATQKYLQYRQQQQRQAVNA
jgi:hypothetical protein